jgi:hypothetical protein
MSRLDGYVVRSEPIRERPVTYIYFASFLVYLAKSKCLWYDPLLQHCDVLIAMLAFVNVATSLTYAVWRNLDSVRRLVWSAKSWSRPGSSRQELEID